MLEIKLINYSSFQILIFLILLRVIILEEHKSLEPVYAIYYSLMMLEVSCRSVFLKVFIFKSDIFLELSFRYL